MKILPLRGPALIVALFLGAPSISHAAPPPSQAGYQINLGVGYSSPSYAYVQVPMWIDSTNTTISPAGLPRPVSTEYPMPVSLVGGAGGSTTSPATATYAGPATGAIATANTAVTVFTAGSIPKGCAIGNPVGNVVLYVDMVTTALAGRTTSFAVQPGQQWNCPYPPTGAVSAVAAQAEPFNAVLY